jgi:hypothetical protein
VAVASGVGLYFAQAAWAAGDSLEGGGLGGAAFEGFILAVALMLQGEKQGAGSC